MKTKIHFFIISHSFFLGMRNVSDKICRENHNTHIVFSNVFFENHVLYKTTWKNTVESDRPPMEIWRMRIARWILKATDTHSEYVIIIVLTLQQWLHVRASRSRYTYIACIVKNQPLDNWSLEKPNVQNLPYITYRF